MFIIFYGENNIPSGFSTPTDGDSNSYTSCGSDFTDSGNTQTMHCWYAIAKNTNSTLTVTCATTNNFDVFSCQGRVYDTNINSLDNYSTGSTGATNSLSGGTTASLSGSHIVIGFFDVTYSGNITTDTYTAGSGYGNLVGANAHSSGGSITVVVEDLDANSGTQTATATQGTGGLTPAGTGGITVTFALAAAPQAPVINTFLNTDLPDIVQYIFMFAAFYRLRSVRRLIYARLGLLDQPILWRSFVVHSAPDRVRIAAYKPMEAGSVVSSSSIS